jgi:hypothetical protein
MKSHTVRASADPLLHPLPAGPATDGLGGYGFRSVAPRTET